MAQFRGSRLAATVLLAFTPAVLCWTISLDSKQGGQRIPVPPSFLGLSLEPDLDVNTKHMPRPFTLEVYANDAVFERLLARLVDYGTGPMIVRFGGHSQDGRSVNWSAIKKQRVWDSLMALCDRLQHKIKYTIPLPLNPQLHPPTDLQLTLGSALEAFRNSPGSVHAINIGSQPEQHTDYMQEGYWTEMSRLIEALQPTISQFKGFSGKLFTGPSVADLKKFSTDDMAHLAAMGKGQLGGPYFKAATIQYDGLVTDELQPAVARARMLGKGLHDPIGIIKNKFSRYAIDADVQGLEFRIDQMMSARAGGILGASNTMAGALYIIKTALTALQYGISGVNYHATGCGPTGPVLFPMICVDYDYVPSNTVDEKFKGTCPLHCQERDAVAEPNTPYYGMWFIQKLLMNHATLNVVNEDTAIEVNDLDNSNDITVYAIESPNTLRVAIVNSREGQGVDMVRVNVNGQDWGFGTVTLLRGEQGLNSTLDQISLAEQRVALNGTLEGRHRTCMVDRYFESDNNEGHYTYYEVPMPAGSAAILVIPDIKQLKGPKYDEWAKRGVKGLPSDVYQCKQAVAGL